MLADIFSAAQILGYLAFVLGVGSFLQKNDKRFKLYMTAECIAYIGHFWLLGNPTAMVSSAVSATRSVLSLYTRSGWIALAVVVINILLGWRLVTEWWHWFPLLASCIGTLALFLLQGIRMRVAMLMGTGLWIANNILAGSYGGTALEIVILIVNLNTIRRMRKEACSLRGTPPQ